MSLHIDECVNKGFIKKQRSQSSCYFTAKEELLQVQSANESTESTYSSFGRRMAPHEEYTCSPPLWLHNVCWI